MATAVSKMVTKMLRPYDQEEDKLMVPTALTVHPSQNIASTATCPTVLLEQTHLSILDLDEAQQVPMRSTLLADGPLLPSRKRSSTLQQECLTNHFYITHHAGCAVLVQQGHLPLGHQSQFRLPPRHQEWATSSCERRTVRMQSSSVLRYEGYRAMASPTLP